MNGSFPPIGKGKRVVGEERRGVVLRCEREGDCNSRSEGGNFGGGGMKDRRVHIQAGSADSRVISVFLANIFISHFFYFLKVNSNILFARCWIPVIRLGQTWELLYRLQSCFSFVICHNGESSLKPNVL